MLVTFCTFHYKTMAIYFCLFSSVIDPQNDPQIIKIKLNCLVITLNLSASETKVFKKQ